MDNDSLSPLCSLTNKWSRGRRDGGPWIKLSLTNKWSRGRTTIILYKIIVVLPLDHLFVNDSFIHGPPSLLPLDHLFVNEHRGERESLSMAPVPPPS